MAEPVRIAMWSGPRNLSTAMMRSFSSRSDCAVTDEPFYAAYLALSGADHPMRSEILKGERDPKMVARSLTGTAPDGAAVFYQKHMAHHMIDGIPRDWMADVRNVFLIRDPAYVVASYVQKREQVSLDDLGYRQLAEMFASEPSPIVIDAADILADPARMLETLCDAVGVGFDPAMLSWPKGPHPSDGVWGAHWYESIWASTGFAAPKEQQRPKIDRPDIMGPSMEIYEAMRHARLS